MVFNVYSIRDVKTGFMTPSIDPSDEAAARNFQHAIWNSTGVIHSFAPDFSLYRIGVFDSDAGTISPIQPPVFVMDGHSALSGGPKDAD